MFFWIIAAFMTFAACMALLLPLLRRSDAGAASASEAHDVEVYRDQIAEIERDHAEGLIDAQEAEIARAEIGRRLLGAARKVEAGEAARKPRRTGRRYVAAAILILVPLAAVPAYLELGAPGAEQQPLSARLSQDAQKSDISVLIADAESHLTANPDDGRGWDVLAPIYLRIGRIDDAENAFRKAIALLGPSASRQVGLGETLVSESDGIVTEEARLIFQSARELDPEDPRPAFFLAMAKAQEGKTDEARRQFQALIDRSTPDAPWIPAIEQQLASLDQAESNEGSNSPTPAEIAAAAAGKSPEERDEMVRSMVSTLESRLARDPNNFDGWKMLIRSQIVVGDQASAQRSLNRALVVFPEAPQGPALVALGNELGLNAKAELGGVPMATTNNPVAAPAAGNGSAASEPFIVPNGEARETETDSPALGNPSAEAIADAEKMSADDRQAMIRSMVASLDEKLTAEPDNIEGWLRLIRSYVVLGEGDEARNAVARAKSAFSGQTEQIGAIDALANDLAIGERN
ncbi:c-type cytochrome biogenesis protein CcmI [Pseudohoeflea suaedae]|uniref:C-type cytochrome biogenesis protein CcmI n=1 Tax=Pseudohoeflea suaedae TaxID=877384 RepID=A0A4R5PQ99_9HYPH|nr:c-type cytochrome biogenesis protein CcmI [Pseudohoeflea suaedae]TDH38861.1 c-type cytochrome biogenesis protein CcmI [Pseudohoeflea suaedae]